MVRQSLNDRVAFVYERILNQAVAEDRDRKALHTETVAVHIQVKKTDEGLRWGNLASSLAVVARKEACDT